MDLEKQPQQPVAPAVPPPAEALGGDGIRASDADRDRTADILREAMAEGRLTADEHAERIDLVYRAKTVGELQPLVRDLPVSSGSTAESPGPRPYSYGPEAPEGPADNLVAVFSSSVRKGRWRVGGRTNAFALFGSVEIDLTEALFGQRFTVINATSIFGSVEVRVPENISLRGNGTGVFGGFEVKSLESADPEAPVVVVNGYAVFGSVEAKPKRGKFVADLQRRLRKHLGH
ncbi:DUF1707 domain-containing protein [Streptomyces fimicarius]|uniref:DUF1707 domain-containing protein n=2 Tax=Streptomyces TaxID=1883 RepID=A0AB33KCX0_9ACTN|nr:MULTISPECIES: DUF1707 domain-containing protein [Streptomyces]WSV23702.1 DUF1707 domain-containing protein [Streptomyces fimicarius]MCL6287600.1 DUF1707 domain-containing protein [Streptomyces sp. 43Y-GA-1]MCX4711347.1 DUF1707 domain-containing protein [Streptomyces griseus]MDX2673290.1 DUF1707 domain-containing protein [Streptomyces sp. NRRL_ISP-5395]MDX3338711.1 DUF1707 domain-containing protein [Streptomyces sp. ME02-6979.5a]